MTNVMTTNAKFWDRIAKKYAKSPVRNMPAYEATLERVRALLGAEDRVLEVGCGTGTTALRLADALGHYTASDISVEMIEIARKKAREAGNADIDFTVAPVLETRFEPESFDAVLGFNIYHLVPDLPTALARAHALVRPGGLFITKTPCLGEMSWFIRALLPVMQAFGKAPFVDSFTAAELEVLVREAGFEIEDARVFDGAPHTRFIVARKI